jgi:uncharacterized damage-inducible protein DinB
MDFHLGMTFQLLSDLSDADLLVRPVPSANHIAWQLGHLINSEVMLLQLGTGMPTFRLPDDFAARHGKETAAKDSATDFLTKAEYIDLFKKVRSATLSALEAMPETTLDNATPESFKSYAPTVGALLMLIANHPLMHSGQFSVVRRKLGKTVLF